MLFRRADYIHTFMSMSFQSILVRIVMVARVYGFTSQCVISLRQEPCYLVFNPKQSWQAQSNRKSQHARYLNLMFDKLLHFVLEPTDFHGCSLSFHAFSECSGWRWRGYANPTGTSADIWPTPSSFSVDSTPVMRQFSGSTFLSSSAQAPVFFYGHNGEIQDETR